MKESAIDLQPWYKQFWPWFIIFLPASVVVAGLTTVYIAFHNADSLVQDDYFKDGLAINQSLERDVVAQQLKLNAEVVWDKITGEILVTMTGDLSGAEFSENKGLALLLLHPTDKAGDLKLPLSVITPGHYRVSLQQALRYRYYLRLVPAVERQWRLNGEVNFETSTSVTLGEQ